MQSSNPIFTRSEGFNGRGNAYGNQTYPGNGQSYGGYGDPSQWGTGTPGTTGTPVTHVDQRPMTIDSVVQKTGITLALVVLAAAATWFMTPAITGNQALGTLYGLSMLGALGGFALAMVNSFKRVISPALVLVFCAAEGVALGAFSKFFDYQYGGGIVIQAVIGTFAAFAGTLAAYRFFDIKVSSKFRMGVMAAVFGMIGLGILQMIVGLFGADLGFFGFGAVGFMFSLVGLVLGILMLVLDFDFVENGIRAGLPERESWRAAFGLTVTIIWIYIQLLRILAILRGQD